MISKQIELFIHRPQTRFREKYDSQFKAAYENLNPEQKEAVDHIDGPVMVIAGPGTGKTQILAVRIGKILRDTDTHPHNILCLTFTDAATLTMRKRLVKIIGPTAHQIHILTFHAFCNQVIQENLGYFGNYRQLEPLAEVEQIDVYRKILTQLSPDHILKNLKGNEQFEMRRLKNLFSFMKKEDIASNEILRKVENYLERKKANKEDKDIYYQRKYKEFERGDLKVNVWTDLEFKMKQLCEASKLLAGYEKTLSKLGRYDYQDMLLWVLRAFEKDASLLARYQERYQYVLVDEYQDTNGTQNNLLEILISFWEDNPNIFVVGDDDQAIYKFQGANVQNIDDFRKRYKPYTIVLERNYRSSQAILDGAKNLISFNKERIVNDSAYGLSKDLRAIGSNKDITAAPTILSFQNETQENTYLAELISEHNRKGENLGKTAVLYRQHSQVKKLVEVLEKKGIPLNIKKSVNILYHPLIRNILTVLHYLNSRSRRPYSAEAQLAELMYFSFFGIGSGDISKIALHLRTDSEVEKNRSWRDTISSKKILDEIGVSDANTIVNLSYKLDKWIVDSANTTLQVLFENVINEGHILRHALSHPDKSWLLQVLNTFFDLIKEESVKKQDLNLDDFLKLIEKMMENEVPLSVNKVIHSDKGINFLTAHGSKGLEFERVFVIGATKDKWDKTPSTRFHYSYPDNLNEDTKTNEEDERRLFFVAMTRAEKELTISYSEKKDSGKALGASQFVDEILGGSDFAKVEKQVAEHLVNRFLEYSLLKHEKKVQLIDDDLVDEVLNKYRLSVTGLNKYLRCPVTFYFEDIVRIPMARNKYLGFGKAIHHAFQYYYQDVSQNEQVNDTSLVEYFEKAMQYHHSHFTKEEFNNFSDYGNDLLKKYYQQFLKNEVHSASYELELKIENADYHGIPIKGVLDKVALDKNRAAVTDYKTGNYNRAGTRKKLNSPTEKEPAGGDYWRQIVFYNILAESDSRLPWKMLSGTIHFVEPDKKTGKFFNRKYIVQTEEIKVVGEQIKDTWDKIHRHEFQNGCNEEHCYWCSFVQNEFVFSDHLVHDKVD